MLIFSDFRNDLLYSVRLDYFRVVNYVMDSVDKGGVVLRFYAQARQHLKNDIFELFRGFLEQVKVLRQSLRYVGVAGQQDFVLRKRTLNLVCSVHLLDDLILFTVIHKLLSYLVHNQVQAAL